MLLMSFWCFYCYLWTYFTPFSSASIVDFEQINVIWEVKLNPIQCRATWIFIWQNVLWLVIYREVSSIWFGLHIHFHGKRTLSECEDATCAVPFFPCAVLQTETLICNHMRRSQKGQGGHGPLIWICVLKRSILFEISWKVFYDSSFWTSRFHEDTIKSEYSRSSLN